MRMATTLGLSITLMPRHTPNRTQGAGRARDAFALASFLAMGCGRSGDCTPPAASSPPAPASFAVHEWGLFGLDIADGARVVAAAGTRPEPEPMTAIGRVLDGDVGDDPRGVGGLGLTGAASGGKPVIYVHLDEGVEEARFSIALGIGVASVAESFPSAVREPARLTFGPVIARRGRCASPTVPPIWSSAECRDTPDRFCEAAEIPRYRGDGDVCLRVGETSSEVLFYRAIGLDPARIPLLLTREGDGYATRNPSGAAIDGPVIFVERGITSDVRYRVLAPSERSGPVPAGGSLVDAAAARALLLAHALSLGLRESEADAFIDAWAPAFFDTRHRTGAEASGPAPAALAASDVSLLYFAPRTLVDAMLPLTIDPPARQVRRAFLVRVVDGARRRELAAGVGDFGRSSLDGLGSGVSHATAALHDAIVPRVRLSRPTVRGGLTSEQVRRVLLRNIAQVGHCYERGLMRNPDVRGEVTIAIEIGATGSASATHSVRSTTHDDVLEACISSAARRWAFPMPGPPGSVVADVRYRLDVPAR